MFVAPGLLYLHPPRTGGTFVANVLEKEGIGSRQLSMEVGGHDGIRAIPLLMRSTALTFSTLRDPWSWYASLDASYRHKGAFDGPLHEYFGRSVPFKEVLRGFTQPRAYPGLRMDHTARYPGARVPEPGLPGKIARSGLGLYSWVVLRMLCPEPLEEVEGVRHLIDQYGDIPWGVQAIIDTAQLSEGLSTIIRAWDPVRAPQIVAAIESSGPQNEKGRFRGVLPSGGGPDPGVYDKEMQSWVVAVDGWLFRRFAFHCPVGHPERHAVTIVGNLYSG